MIKHLDDIESDLSAVHRIDDIWTMEAGRFFRLAWRLPAYQGVMRMHAEKQAMDEEKRTGGVEAVPVAAGELHKIGEVRALADDGWLTFEQASD